MRQKQKLRITDTNTIAVFEQSSLYWHVVNERAVETLEIGEHEPAFFLFDFGMTTRDGCVGNAQIRRGLTTNDERLFVEGEDCSFEFARNGCETRRHGQTRLTGYL